MAGTVDPEESVEKNGYRFTGNGFAREDDVVVVRRHQEQRPKYGTMNNVLSRNNHILPRNEAIKLIKPSILNSTASSNESVDGYDSFENTNNKKKRKIPTSASLGSHNSSLSADMAHMALSSAHDVDLGPMETDSGVAQYYGSGSSAVPAITSGNGISGAGRGRYGRAGTRHYSGRSPLGVSVNGSNSLQGIRSPYQRKDYAANGTRGSEGNGSS